MKNKPKVVGWVCHAPERGMFHKIHSSLDHAKDEAIRIADKDNVHVNVYRLVMEGCACRANPPVEWVEG